MKRKVVTENFDKDGKLYERITEEEWDDETEVVEEQFDIPATGYRIYPLTPNIITTPPGTYTWNEDATKHCSCRIENGGSGVCGCIYGGSQVTY